MRFIRSAAIGCVALTAAGSAWTAIPAAASTPTPSAQVNTYYNAVAKAGTTFEKQFKVDVAGYGATSEETFAAMLAEQTLVLATPLENEQTALLNLMLDTKYNSKTRIAAAILATTITKFVYVLGIAGFAAGGSAGIEGWAKTFQSTKTSYQTQSKTVMNDLGYAVGS